ncbi:DUF5325 family protein [Sediminibacillus halophilus]|uniref:Uncharacterized protein n=1 Tax=Sediminibacillus halophilus TaxID=482461 RepID=A0A1G9MVX1_9BACI|nr:DUF5325 family protein [Sediminibacillus halophilus]SDL78274.1 hypothetical protein SAMN05216244_0744 [Sediminibacillus halophilus]
MKKIQLPMLLLAVLVIASFVAAGVAIGFRNYLWMVLFILAGFLLMGLGLARKRSRQTFS